ncbi:MAG: hypothetical protein IKX59_10775 [Bacteroidales bacterium]|nr:hypothetical protein [Bacteroidales bacterium]
MERHDATPTFDKDTLVGCKFFDGNISVQCYKSKCSIVASLPKVLKPSNIEPLRREEIAEAVQIIGEVVEQKAEFLRVSSVELFNAWDMEHAPIEYFCRLGDAGRYMPREQDGTTLYYGRLLSRPKKVLCFYDKSVECMERHGILMAGNILRYELRLNGRLGEYGITTLSDLLRPSVAQYLEGNYKAEYDRITKINVSDMEKNKDAAIQFWGARHPDEVSEFFKLQRERRDLTSVQRYRNKCAIEELLASGKDDLIAELDAKVEGTRWA